MRLEEKLAEFKRTEAALTFSSGYAAALGTLGALAQKDDVVILDKLCHASLIDGAKLSGAVVRVFPHNHLGKLESHLQWARENYPEARVIVVTESVFSMDGDWAALAEIVEIKNRYGALLLLDEAHAVGVIGQHGRGLADQLGLAGKMDMQMGTLSKALGGERRLHLRRAAADRSAHQSRAELHLLHRALAGGGGSGDGGGGVSDVAAGRAAAAAARGRISRISRRRCRSCSRTGRRSRARSCRSSSATAEAAVEAAQVLAEQGLLRAGDPLSHRGARCGAAAGDDLRAAHAEADQRPVRGAAGCG